MFASVTSGEDVPVKVIKTTHFAANCQYGYDKCVTVQYQNIGDKEIVAVEFDIVFIDVMGEKHTYSHHFLTENHGILMYKPVGPGKKKEATWDNPLYDYCRKYEVTVLKVAFKDGTLWEAKSTQSDSPK